MRAIQMQSGIITRPSLYSVEETVEKLEALLHEKGIKLFALVDHSGVAEAAGLHMPATKLLVFGNPRAGTPVMLATPSAALDLPLKVLVAEGADGKVSVSWNDPAYFLQRHGIPAELLPNISAVEALISPLTLKS